MKAIRMAGRCLVLAVTLVGLAACSSAAAQVGASELARLVAFAQEDLARLGVQAEGIALASVSTAAFPCDPMLCPGHQPSQAIRLRAGGELYEYQADAVGELLILWRELP